MNLVKRIFKKGWKIIRPTVFTFPNLISYFRFANKKHDRKFVVVSHEASQTGAPILALNISKNIKESDHLVLLVSLLGGKLRRDYKANSDFTIFYPSRLVLFFLRHSKYHILINTVVAASRIKSIKGKNNYVVSLIHEMPDIISDALLISEKKIKAITTLSDIIVFPSKYNLDIFEKKFGEINIPKKIMPQGLYKDTSIELSREEAKREVCQKYNIDPEADIYLSCAFISKVKGFDFFYSLANDYSYNKKVHFIWAGNPTVFYDEFKKEKGIKEMPDNLTITGFISDQKEISKLYSSASYFLMLSRQETFPSTILESFSLGTPVIAFDKCGGYIEIMDGNGYLVEPYDINKIADILNTTKQSDPSYIKMSENCKILIKESFDFKGYVDRLLKLYPNK